MLFEVCQLAVIYTKQTVSRNANYKTETRIWAGNQTLIPNGDGFTYEGAAVLTGKAEFSRWQSADNKNFGKNNILAGGIV